MRTFLPPRVSVSVGTQGRYLSTLRLSRPYKPPYSDLSLRVRLFHSPNSLLIRNGVSFFREQSHLI